MTSGQTELHPVELLATEFVQRLRDGEAPQIAAWAERHPELSDQIYELFPTIVSLESARAHGTCAGEDDFPATIENTPERLGDLRLIREIGRGGMGVVYEAVQESLQRHVAVKVLARDSVGNPDRLRRFQREARTAAGLHHTNIVPVLGIGQDAGHHYYVMQKISGASLEKLLPVIRRSRSDGTGSSPDDFSIPTDGWPSAIASALMQGRLRTDTVPDSNADDDHTKAANGPPAAAATSLIVTGDFFREYNGQAQNSARDRSGGSGEKNAAAPVSAYWQSVATIGWQVADALAYAHHHGTMHRDIKPANLIIDLEGTVWVADFGLAKALEQDDVTRTGDIVGTLKYMAPEQLAGQADARSDVFSLGVTLYELTALQPAWEESDRRLQLAGRSGTVTAARLRSVNRAIPRDLETIIHKAIAEEPRHRYQTADLLAADLQRFVEGRPVQARRSPPWERLWRWSRRNPALAATSAAALLLLCAVAIISSVGYVRVARISRDEQQQRTIAERNAELALSTLDRIFERFTPRGLPVTFRDDSGGPQTPPAVLSAEAAQLLQELVIHYQDLRDQTEDGSRYRERVAVANRRLGDIYQRLGQPEAARQAYRGSLTAWTQPGSAEESLYAAEAARLHIEIGRTFRQQRKFDEAFNAWSTAEEILNDLRQQQDSDAVRTELARLYYLQIRRNSLAPRGGHGRPRNASEHDARPGTHKLEQAVQMMEQLTTAHPQVPAYSHLLGLLYLEASNRSGRTDRDMADDFRDQAIDVLQTVVDSEPDDPEYRFALCGALAAGNPRDERRDHEYFDAFAERLTRAASVIRRLTEFHPHVPSYQAFQAVIHHKLGTVLMQLGYSSESELRYISTIDLYGRLSRRYPGSSDYYDIKQALARQSLAGLLIRQDTLEALTRARDELNAGIRVLEGEVLNSADSEADRDVVETRLQGCRRQLNQCAQRLKVLEQERPGDSSQASS